MLPRFIKMLTLTDNALTFYLGGEADNLADYLEAIDVSLSLTNAAAEREVERDAEPEEAAARQLHARDQRLDEQLEEWATVHPERRPLSTT